MKPYMVSRIALLYFRKDSVPTMCSHRSFSWIAWASIDLISGER